MEVEALGGRLAESTATLEDERRRGAATSAVAANAVRNEKLAKAASAKHEAALKDIQAGFCRVLFVSRRVLMDC